MHDNHCLYGWISLYSCIWYHMFCFTIVQTKINICKCRNGISDIKMSFFLCCERWTGLCYEDTLSFIQSIFLFFFFFSLLFSALQSQYLNLESYGVYLATDGNQIYLVTNVQYYKIKWNKWLRVFITRGECVSWVGVLGMVVV